MDEARDTPAVPEPPAPARAPAHTLPPPSAAFGWAPVGERLLREFSQTHAAAESAPTVRYAKTWREIKALPIVPQLVTMAVQQMVLLHAVDTMPRGGRAGRVRVVQRSGPAGQLSPLVGAHNRH